MGLRRRSIIRRFSCNYYPFLFGLLTAFVFHLFVIWCGSGDRRHQNIQLISPCSVLSFTPYYKYYCSAKSVLNQSNSVNDGELFSVNDANQYETQIESNRKDVSNDDSGDTICDGKFTNLCMYIPAINIIDMLEYIKDYYTTTSLFTDFDSEDYEPVLIEAETFQNTPRKYIQPRFVQVVLREPLSGDIENMSLLSESFIYRTI